MEFILGKNNHSLSSIFPEECVWSASLSSKGENFQHAWNFGKEIVTWSEGKRVYGEGLKTKPTHKAVRNTNWVVKI